MGKKANKVGILTFHRANNYGAVLQAYALQTYLETIGVNAEIVDYRSAYLEKAYRGHSLANKDIKKLLRDLSDWPIRYLKNKAFEKYRKQYLNLSKTYLENNVIESNNMYDYFLFGSDQIWNYNLSGKDSNYLGAFVSDKKKLNSYADEFWNI
ncbi:MAG: polysaccharide pyruvyl transferase family protein [Oscillospiraceae bacterium]